MEHLSFIEYLTEVAVHRDDPEMAEYYGNEDEAHEELEKAPYAVGWEGQYMEWYSNDGGSGPETGEGRWKMKGDGGEIVATNVPTYELAQKIEDQLNDSYNRGDFYDPFVQNYELREDEHSWALTEFHGTFIVPMSQVTKLDKISKQVKDYSEGK
jgi:hypothetical protein